MGKSLWKIYGAFSLIFLFCSCSVEQAKLFLDDRAGLLTKEQEAQVEQYHEVLLRDLDVHFRLVILEKESADINRDAVFEFGSLGEKTSAARGVLFLVDPEGKQVRIEIGYDLEGVFPDGLVGYLEEKQMAPFFRNGQVANGIMATGELLVSRLISGDSVKEQNVNGSELDHYSGGAGARVDLSVEKNDVDKGEAVSTNEYLPGTTPEETLIAYKELLTNRIKDPNLPLFTLETRRFFAQWVVTDAQQQNELRSLEEGGQDGVIIEGDYAVLRFQVQQRTNAPYFFQKEEQGWMLDFATMSRVIRMNHKNQWHLVSCEHPYMFGFVGWRFDKNGFPHSN